MDIYLNALYVLKELFKHNAMKPWEQWIERDIEEWKFDKSTNHHKLAYGGMGSINDQYINNYSPEGCWQNTLFDNVKLICFEFSRFKSIDLNKLKKTGQIQLSGFICHNCMHAEITSRNLEFYLSEKFIPELLFDFLPNEKFVLLNDIKTLMNTTLISDLRNRILANLLPMKITYNPYTATLPKKCPHCQKENRGNYYWKIDENKNNPIIRP